MTFDFGWKGKTERLRQTVLMAGPVFAKEMPPALAQVVAIFRRVHQAKDGRGLREEIERVPDGKGNEPPPTWEPLAVRGWKLQATMYLQNGQLWWLVHAECTSLRGPRAADVAYLHKILEHLGADVVRDMIIGPGSEPPGANPMPFGWWTWFNRAELL